MTNMQLDFVLAIRRASGLPVRDMDEVAYYEQDLEAMQDVKRLLLLNSTCNGDTLEDVVRCYEPGSIDGCILTKLDEADYPWGLLHLMTESPLRISCCSMKPGIESHPEPFSAAALVSRLIAGIRSELDAARTAEVADLPVAAVAPLRRSPPAARKGARRA